MQKKELRKIPWDTIYIGEGDNEYYYISAEVVDLEEKEILMLHFFKGKNKGLKTEANFRVFISQEDYITQWAQKSGIRWKIGSIESLIGYGWTQRVDIDRTASRETIALFFSEWIDPVGAISEHQEKVKRKRLLERHEMHEREIDEYLSEVQDIPDNFLQWADKVAMVNSRYIYYDYKSGRKEQNGYCTYCEADVQVKPRHNQHGVCPKCEAKVQFKAMKKAGQFWDDERIALLQKFRGETMVRYFSMMKNYNDPRNPTVKLHECYREIHGAQLLRVYEWRKHPSTEKTRWYEDNKIYNFRLKLFFQKFIDMTLILGYDIGRMKQERGVMFDRTFRISW